MYRSSDACESTAQIENFSMVKKFFHDARFGYYIVAGTVGHKEEESDRLNTIDIMTAE